MISKFNIPKTNGSEFADEFKVSVIIAHYNAGSKINNNLEQLSNQTMSPDDFEVIVIDDKSPNGIDNLMSFSDRIKNLKIIVEPVNNGYPSIPRNHGIDASKGTFIMIIDQDDYIANNALEKLVEIAGSESDVIIPKYEEGSDFKGTQVAFKKGNILNATVYDHILSPLAPHKMFRRKFLNDNDIRFFSHEYVMVAEDQVFVIRAYSKAQQISILADDSYYFWTNQDEHLGSYKRYRINEPWKGINILKESLKALDDSTKFTNSEKEYAISTYVGRFVDHQQGGVIAIANQMLTIDKREEFIQEISKLIKKYLSPTMISAVRERAIYLVWGLWHGLTYNKLKDLQENLLNSTVNNVKIGKLGLYRSLEVGEKIHDMPVNFLNEEKIKLVGFSFDRQENCFISVNIINDLAPNGAFEAALLIVQRNGDFLKKIPSFSENSSINRQFNISIGTIIEDDKKSVYDFYIQIKRGGYVKKYRIGKEVNEHLVHYGRINKSNGTLIRYYPTVGGYLALEIES